MVYGLQTGNGVYKRRPGYSLKFQFRFQAVRYAPTEAGHAGQRDSRARDVNNQ